MEIRIFDAEKFWDKTAAGYAKISITDDESYQRKLSETRSFLEKDMRILEFGCGTGTTAAHHSPYVQHIDATDISDNMLEIGRERAKSAGLDNITFTRGTLEEFNAEDASFDAVLGLNIIHLLPDRQSLFTELARIIKPGGGCKQHRLLGRILPSLHQINHSTGKVAKTDARCIHPDGRTIGWRNSKGGF